MNMENEISIREYAEIKGVSVQAIYQELKKERE
jgi:predicted DNA-binding protein YlxM (UPF0122 family)